MKFLILALVAHSAVAFGQTNLEENIAGYMEAGTGLRSHLTRGEIDPVVVQEGLQAMIDQVLPVLQAYAGAFPVCEPQLSKIVADADLMLTLSEREIFVRYHRGDDLPPGPRQCYYPRDLVVHPAIAYALAGDGIAASEVRRIDHEVEEVLEHIERVAEELGL